MRDVLAFELGISCMPLLDTGQAQTLGNTQGVMEGQPPRSSSSYPTDTNTVEVTVGVSMCDHVSCWERSVGETSGGG